ncbi:hypothetical protein V6N13_039417 [Hibiscus sabdariffa]|uniref:Uncharacterized protein n=1 Tax=Hibiscus sabdariffa TaxID=183260 RepID=A0ABR2SWC8_9ROSI
MASSGNPNLQPQSGDERGESGGGGFDLNKPFKSSSNPMLHLQNMKVVATPPNQSQTPSPNTPNLTTSPSFPAQSSTQPPPPYLTLSSSYPSPTRPYPFHHYLPYPPPPQHQHQHPLHPNPNPNPNPNPSLLNTNRPIPFQPQSSTL